MKKLPFFLSKLAPWLLGLVVVIGIPFAYLQVTRKTISDFLFNPEITISDGNVVKQYSSGKEITLVDKDDYEDIIRFSAVSQSSDDDKMCFLGHTVAPIWMYWSHIDGSDVTEVGVAENCVWSNDSSMISYTNHTTEVSPHNVYIYDLKDDDDTNMTESVSSLDLMRIYTAPEWADDDSYLTSEYIEYDMENDMASTEGTTKIDVDTGKLEEL